MQAVYAGEPIVQGAPSIFLVGPTPRSQEVKSWRPEALMYLEDMKFKGIVYVPENRNQNAERDYVFNAEWEHEALNDCTIIAAWVPRDLETMPAFTTNVEFGYFVTSGKLFYGRPDDAPKNGYLDWLYQKETERAPCWNLQDLMVQCYHQVK